MGKDFIWRFAILIFQFFNEVLSFRFVYHYVISNYRVTN